MRIISGEHKGRRLQVPKKLPVRPTTDMAKEALFNILANRVDFEDIKLLELFAGTGNISYEFASRGTQEITCVDAHYACTKYIEKTAKELDFSIESIKSDVYKYLNAINSKFDIIFADPPYSLDQEKFEELLEIISQNNLLKPEGFFILEHPKRMNFKEFSGFQESRRYGDSMFSFFN